MQPHHSCNFLSPDSELPGVRAFCSEQLSNAAEVYWSWQGLKHKSESGNTIVRIGKDFAYQNAR